MQIISGNSDRLNELGSQVLSGFNGSAISRTIAGGDRWSDLLNKTNHSQMPEIPGFCKKNKSFWI